MYRIDVKQRTTEKIEQTTFSEIGLKERNDIQEWIANDPSILEYSSELLIIQKEFDGFSDTDRRLDLLALDGQGNLVIIENKRDDTGKDVVWQAINYASFCSTLNSDDVIKIYGQYLQKNNIDGDAEQLIKDFFEDETKVFPTDTQKIILVSREFRKEVLSAAQWLNSNGIDITCIKFTPFKFKDEILLDVDRILPQEEIKDYTLKLAQKNSDTKNQTIKRTKAEQRNLDFWRFFSEKFEREGTIFENINSWNANKNSWVGATAPFGRGLYYNFVISDSKCRVEIYIDRVDKVYNKNVFDALYDKKSEIENKVAPYLLKWERLDNKRASRISIETEEFSLASKENWGSVADWFIPAMKNLTDTLEKYASLINDIKNK